MENKDPKSWSSAHIHQSQWLQTTLSDGDNSPNLEGMHGKWRGDLVQMLEEFGQSYRVLAVAYNQLKFKTSHGDFHLESLSSSGRSETICAICNRRATGNLEDKKLEECWNHHLDWNHHPKYSVEHSDIKFDSSNLGIDLLNQQGDECHEFLSADLCSMKFKSELEWRHSNGRQNDKIFHHRKCFKED
ncbi:hypothetical protein JHK84_044546 [Glycine max]|nr:hypothetical protein JHK85_045033 [Glycine max]KAG5107639.1 hypothetical protein JHK84_044546 [Glycine max]